MAVKKKKIEKEVIVTNVGSKGARAKYYYLWEETYNEVLKELGKQKWEERIMIVKREIIW